MLSFKWKNPHTRRLVFSYGKDWLLVFIMTIVFFMVDLIPPFHREFSLQDTTIMYTYTENETVPPWSLALICLVAPMAVIGLISLCFQRSIHDFHSGVLGLCLALSMTIMLTDIIKITSGRPRPDFISRCQPPAGSVDPPLGISNVSICTTPIDSHIMVDGYKSFPSGHSSFSFAGLGYTAFYLGGKMHMFDERGHTYKCFTFAFPSLGAILVAISRTCDYRHHWQDVFIGSLLGTIAYFAYRQYYPSLIHVQCDAPYAMRSLAGSPDLEDGGRDDDGNSMGSNNSLGVRIPQHEPYSDYHLQQQQRNKSPSPPPITFANGSAREDRY
ncbi:phosphatidic acid phosphatase type 2/haloperoxidase [Phascolomyces articulosus]|uniref:Phosphatidic acid phosphatase type 2/haloperoxidase n=1 Tax=Phascolomyces articulosus TaxID=60185 RepID=A0AAD5KF71_9FUNG|nr:phosphatidic acid phosphatase type 2/haloperoxidase [Phascolomyces articulosus]